MQTKISSSNFLIKITLLLFMLFSVDFLGMGWYIFGLSFAVAALYLIITQKRIVCSSQLVWITLLAASNFLIMFYHSSRDIVTVVLKYLISPIGGYIMGIIFSQYKFKKRGTQKDKDVIIQLYMFAVIPYFIHGVLNLIGYEGVSGFERDVPDFWTGQMWKATLACTYFAMTVPMCFFVFITKGIYKKIFYIVLTAFPIYATIITASRTVVYIGIIIIMLELMLYISETKSSKTRLKILIGFFVIVAIAAVLIISNLDKLSSTFFFSRMTGSDMSEEPRIRLFRNIIVNCWAYPFGNMPYFYSHNTWLDFLRESGWITFFCFCMVTVGCVKNIRLLYKNKRIDMVNRIALVGMMGALLLDMFVEPMMDGSTILFCLFFYFLGVNDYCVQYEKWRAKNV